MPPPNADSVPPERLAANLKGVRDRIAEAATKAGRNPAGVKLVAVTKSVGVETIQELLKLGVKELGENRLQVARPKVQALEKDMEAAGARWRFIGHLQTNKVKYVLREFSHVDAVDSLHLLEAIAKDAPLRGRDVVPCLAEVNVSGEQQKHGLKPDDLQAFLARAAELPTVAVHGLMTMAPDSDDLEGIVRPVFRRLRELREQANAAKWYPQPLAELSMGMTNDFPIAVEEGATMVRVGSALFA